MMKLEPYQEEILRELKLSDNPLRIFASWKPGTGKSIVISVYIQELREVNWLMVRVLENLMQTNSYWWQQVDENLIEEMEYALDKARKVLHDQ